MHTRQFHPVRPPFSERNISSTSLDGMEKPVRSFNSFLKTVPPHPTAHKPLPPVPSSDRLPTPPTPQKVDATADDQSSFDFEPPHLLRSSSARDRNMAMNFDELSAVSLPRTYSPLIPEPSPDIIETTLELPSKPHSSSKSPSTTRLTPIHERNYTNFSPPRTPPLSPLPVPPGLAPPTIRIGPPSPHSEPSRSGQVNISKANARPTTVRNSSRTSRTEKSPSPNFSRSKAFVALGLEASQHEPPSPVQRQLSAHRQGSESYPAKIDPRVSGQFDVSEDYHFFLVDEYRERATDSSPASESKSNTRVSPQEIRHGLVPSPLLWSKDSGDVSASKTQRRKIRADDHQPYGFGILNASQPSQGPAEPRKSGAMVAKSARRMSFDALRNKGILGKRGSASEPSRPGKPSSISNHTFSNIYAHARKPLKLRKRREASEGGKSKQRDASVLQSLGEPNSSLTPSSIANVAAPGPVTAYALQPSGTISHRSSGSTLSSIFTPSINAQFDIPTSSKLPPQSSTQHPPNTWPTPPTPSPDNVDPGPLTGPVPTSEPRQSHRGSIGSKASVTHSPLSVRTHSRHSSHSSPPTTASAAGSPKRPERPSSWRLAHPDAEEAHKPSFIGRIQDEWKRHNREVRQEKLKKSIKVLGPTDPATGEGYVTQDSAPNPGRKPGYMGRAASAETSNQWL